MTVSIPRDIGETESLLSGGGYVASRPLATAVYLSLAMPKPLFLEGEAGVGKTEVAKTLAARLGRELIRLQCWEGMDISAAAYEWDYSRQLLEAQLARAEGGAEGVRGRVWSRDFLLERPLLRALEAGGADGKNEGGSGGGGGSPVLLIDELDRADEPFDAFLLEFLSDFQLTIPEWGTVSAERPPHVILTSNRTREVHDAIKRRCLYHWVDYPDAGREMKILRLRAPEAGEMLSRQIVDFVRRLRGVDLFKLPGVAETIDWAHALVRLNCESLSAEAVENTLGALLKYQDDLAKVSGDKARELLAAEGGES